MTLGAMDFINGCILEQTPSIRCMKLSDEAQSWPYFLRNKTGSAAAYAFMLFPKDLKLDLSVYIQVIEDIVLFTNLVNDVLSFHKEYLAGETNNYVSNRAHVTRRHILDTLQDVVDDSLAAHARVTKVLHSTDAAIHWKRFVNGHMAFHFTLKRYRLDDLGFS
ncbi:hypothetical protein GALMADRAFT_1343921 [Galerina marginata CBS 339.88]|uniref:Terpene synthase n=1 Tax=Galerina marginata (strain CBS 339.88) TaxID=685588 RepID=A0A067SQH1_GALM3|nr:hypothetical protein GALMADRAFT_1343921 [Galerina marginata CBS 339.88]